jgi:soluble lytic murein transglycosylase-like protein
MQLRPPTARDYSVTDAFDPRQNIFAGARHLRVLLDRFGGDTTLALAAYNAGAAAVSRYLPGLPPYAETVAYVPKVLGRLAELRREPSP